MLARSALRRAAAPLRKMSSLAERKDTLKEHRKMYYSNPAVGVDNPTYLKGPNDKYVIPVLMTLVGSGVCCVGYALSILAFR